MKISLAYLRATTQAQFASIRAEAVAKRVNPSGDLSDKNLARMERAALTRIRAAALKQRAASNEAAVEKLDAAFRARALRQREAEEATALSILDAPAPAPVYPTDTLLLVTTRSGSEYPVAVLERTTDTHRGVLVTVLVSGPHQILGTTYDELLCVGATLRVGAKDGRYLCTSPITRIQVLKQPWAR